MRDKLPCLRKKSAIQEWIEVYLITCKTWADVLGKKKKILKLLERIPADIQKNYFKLVAMMLTYVYEVDTLSHDRWFHLCYDTLSDVATRETSYWKESETTILQSDWFSDRPTSSLAAFYRFHGEAFNFPKMFELSVKMADHKNCYFENAKNMLTLCTRLQLEEDSLARLLCDLFHSGIYSKKRYVLFAMINLGIFHQPMRRLAHSREPYHCKKCYQGYTDLWA